MELCQFAKYTKCTKCNVVYYKECSKFILTRLAYLTRVLKPFDYNKSIKVSDSAVYSKDVARAKSACVKYAQRTASEVKKLSINQVLSLVLSNEDVEGKVFYIEYTKKLAGDSDKIKGVLTSFIDKIVLAGGYVSVYIAPGIVCPLDITKL